METIRGYEAIARMRQIKHQPGAYFTLHHLTWNEKNQTSNGMRVVERARIRTALPKEAFARDEEMYLTYTDINLEAPRMCYKKLIRFVAFPPKFELLKVNWL